MTTYLEELVRPQPPEDVGLGGMTEKETEEEVPGYRMAGLGRGKVRSESSGCLRRSGRTGSEHALG